MIGIQRSGQSEVMKWSSPELPDEVAASIEQPSSGIETALASDPETPAHDCNVDQLHRRGAEQAWPTTDPVPGFDRGMDNRGLEMRLEKLPEEVRTSVEKLVRGFEAALTEDDETSHTTAVSVSSISDDQVDNPNPVLNGGTIRAPGKPPFDYDKRVFSKLHRAALDSGKRLLHTIILRAERSSTSQPWRAQAKVVTRPEYSALRDRRIALDAEIKAELIGQGPDAKWVSFGRDNRGAPVRLVKKTGAGVQDLTPTPKLKQLFAQAEAVYREADLDPGVLEWTLRGADLEFRDYFE